MHGVIIWSDKAQGQSVGRAVIWCEDHGDLAFYGGKADGSEQTATQFGTLEPGDLVYFDLREDNGLRLAFNPRLVSADEYPTLMQDLKETGREIASATRMKPDLRSVPPIAGGNSR